MTILEKIMLLISQYHAIKITKLEIKLAGGCAGSQDAAGNIAASLIALGCSEDKAVETSVDLIMTNIEPILSSFQMQFNFDTPVYDFTGLYAKKVID